MDMISGLEILTSHNNTVTICECVMESECKIIPDEAPLWICETSEALQHQRESEKMKSSLCLPSSCDSNRLNYSIISAKMLGTHGYLLEGVEVVQFSNTFFHFI